MAHNAGRVVDHATFNAPETASFECPRRLEARAEVGPHP